MKLLAKPIDTMVVFRANTKIPRPYKFKIEEGGELVTVKVDQIIDAQKTKTVRQGRRGTAVGGMFRFHIFKCRGGQITAVI